MEKKEQPKRDEKGDVKFDMGEVDWKKIRQSEYTYVFRYYDEKKNYYFPYFGLFSSADERMAEAKKDAEFFETKLYLTPDHPPYDFFIHYHNSQLQMRVEFFKEVFEERAFLEGYQPSHKYYKIILKKSKYNEIINCINDYCLLPIRDLLFEVIAIAQHKYVETVAYWEKPEMQKLINTAEKETQKAIEVVGKLDTTAWERGEQGAKPPPELKYINFVFNDGAVRIEHNWIAREFIEHFKKYYESLHYKDWRMDLERYPDRFEENIKQQQFKYKLAKSFYNLLTKTGFFKVSKQQPTPNHLMNCITKLIEFCLIPVADTDELDEVKIKIIRNWIKRNELQPAVTYAEIPADKKRLLKYFEKDLINITDDIKRADAISIAYYLSQRFKMDHLFNDFVHIAQALREYTSHIGHQMIGEGRPFEPAFPEFVAFSELVNGLKNQKRISSLKYKFEDNEKEYELTQRLPLYLIEEAMKDYSEEQQVEFDTEPVKTTIIKPKPGTYQIQKANQFAEPEERFMVRFVKAFYDYLLAEAPPTNEWDLMPSERYYALIANMLQGTWFFYHKMHSEDFIIKKVKQWHQMAINA